MGRMQSQASHNMSPPIGCAVILSPTKLLYGDLSVHQLSEKGWIGAGGGDPS